MDLLTAGVQVELDADLELDRQRRTEALKSKLTRMLAQGNGDAAIDQMMSLMLEMERLSRRLQWSTCSKTLCSKIPADGAWRV